MAQTIERSNNVENIPVRIRGDNRGSDIDCAVARIEALSPDGVETAVIGFGAVGDVGRAAVVKNATTLFSRRVAANGAVRQGQCARVANATTAFISRVATDSAVDERQAAIVVNAAAALRGMVAADGAVGDRQVGPGAGANAATEGNIAIGNCQVRDAHVTGLNVEYATNTGAANHNSIGCRPVDVYALGSSQLAESATRTQRDRAWSEAAVTATITQRYRKRNRVRVRIRVRRFNRFAQAAISKAAIVIVSVIGLGNNQIGWRRIPCIRDRADLVVTGRQRNRTVTRAIATDDRVVI